MKIKNKSEWSFVTSTRFWALVIGAGALYLNKDGYITEALMTFLTVVSGGFIVIRSVDRTAEKLSD